MTYKLKTILDKIARIQFEEIGNFTRQELWRWMLFDQENSPLNQGLDIHEPSGVPIKGRSKELDINVSITGDYYCFTFVEHQPLYQLQKVNSPDDLANLILSKGGINNSFTTMVVAIIKGKVLSFLEKETSNQLELDLIYDIQEIISKLDSSNFSELAKQGHICLIKYKNQGLTQQEAYDTVFYIAKIYQALDLDFKNDLADECLDYISGYIESKKLWVWEMRL